MKYQKIYVIVGAVIVLVVATVLFLKSNNQVANKIVDTGISEVHEVTATSSTGVVSTLAVRSVENKAAYSRMQSDWVWKKTTYSNPAWAAAGPVKNGDFVLTLKEDKTFSVKGDCNAISGSYALDKNIVSGIETEDEMSLGEIKVNAVTMTKKYCEWSKENAFMKDFSKVSSYNMRTLQLELLLPNDAGTMIFERKEELEG